MSLTRLAGYRKLIAFTLLLLYFAWLTYMQTADAALATLASAAVTAFGVYVTGHVVQERGKASGEVGAKAD